MRTAARVLLPVLGACVATAAFLALRWRYGGTLDDFEGPFRPVEWTFSAGEEFAGASGTYARTASAAHTGAYGGEIRFDFSRGGRYVQVFYPLRYRGAVTGVRLWARGSSAHVLALRVKDANDQVFQKEIGLAPRSWAEFTVAFDEWSESWGGPNDGVLKQPVRGLAILVVNSAPEPRGHVSVDDVQRWDAPIPQPPPREHLPPHPRLLTSREELDQARKRVRSEPWARSMLEQMERECRAEVARGIAAPDRGGQCEHWYVCPKHGASLRYEGPHRHVCPVGGEVFSGWPYDDVTIAQEHKRLSKLVVRSAVLYALTDDAFWRDVARRILMDYASRYPSYPLHDIHGRHGRGGRAWAQSLDEAVWLVRLLQAADLVWDTFAQAGRDRLVRHVVTPAVEEVIRPARLRFHNIQCWHNAAIGLAGYLTGNRAWIAEAVDGTRGYWAQLRNAVNQDGQWNEGSWGYHFYALEALVTLAEAAHHSAENLYGTTLRSMFAAPLDAAMPDGTLPAFNDSSRVALERYDLYETALRRLGDQRFAIPLHGGDTVSLRALLHGVRPLPDVQKLSSRSRVMKHSGYVILSRGTGTDAAWVCVKYGPHGGDHGHPDKNSLVFYRKHRMVLDDPGAGPYLTRFADAWYKATVAHNSVVRDHSNQHPTTGELVAFEPDGPVPMSLTDAGGALGGLRFRRAVFLLDDDTLAVLDLLHADRGVPLLDVVWHPSGRWHDQRKGRPVQPESAVGYRFLRDLRETRARCWVGRTSQGEDPVELRILPSHEASFLAGTGIGSHASERIPAVLCRLRSASCAVLTTLRLAARIPDATSRLAMCYSLDRRAISPGVAMGAYVTARGRSWLLVSNPERRTIQCSGRIVRTPLAAIDLGDGIRARQKQ